MLKEYLNPLNGEIENDISFFSGGINSYNNKAFIQTDQLPFAVNVTVDEQPVLCPRNSREHVIAIPDLGTILTLWALDQNHIFVAVRNTDLEIKVYLLYYNVASQIWEVTPIDFDLGGTPTFCYCKDGTHEYLYAVSNYKKLKITLADNYGIQSWAEIDDDYKGIPCWHKGRMFFANTKTRIITYSALYDYDNFTEVPDDPDPDIDYSSYAGDFLVTNSVGNVTMIKSFDDKLVIFCEHSMHLLYGDTPLINSTSQFQLVDLNNNLGCVSPKTVAVGGGLLYWLGDDSEVYSYSGSSIDTISSPMKTRYVTRNGGIHKKYFSQNVYGTFPLAIATSNKYYIVTMSEYVDWHDKMLVYDAKSHVWWAEDANIIALANFSHDYNNILIVTPYGEILKTTQSHSGEDRVWNFQEHKLDVVPIEYEFHTKVFGADGTDSRKSVSKLWFQASANADVYLSDNLSKTDHNQVDEARDKKVGSLKTKGETHTLETYESNEYEQQPIYIQKMYGQRLNTFQIKVKGEGPAKFYLMKREWDAR